uniref:RNA-directed RNA polymerase n=1 Tax=Erigeron annuus picorna-like virus TaxID=2739849 RepID=A0A6M9BKG7_9VIRU|nr:hypothetical protein [Erigeron annuus picorna-like virus]
MGDSRHPKAASFDLAFRPPPIEEPVLPPKELSPKPSIGEQLEQIDDFMSQWKVTSTLVHISHLLKAKRTKTRLATLVAIIENFQDKGALQTAQRLYNCYPQVASFLGFARDAAITTLPGDYTAVSLQEQNEARARAGQVFAGLQETAEQMDNLPQDLTIDPTLPMDKQPEILQQMDKIMPWLRPIMGLAAVMAATMGLTKLLTVDWFKETSKEVIALANTIKANKVISQAAEESTDTILSLVYSAFGGTYINPKQKRLKLLCDKITKMEFDTGRFIDKTKTDPFGVIRHTKITDLETKYAECVQQVNALAVCEKSLFNFSGALHNIRANIDAIRDRFVGLTIAGNKQEPVVMWFVGDPGVGKSKIAEQVALRVTGESAFQRNDTEEHWNNYRNQQAVILDDLFQNPSSTLPSEFMNLATETARTVNMASLLDKGTPFTSRFIFVTSNFWCIREHPGVASNQAFDRRRHYLVQVLNPALKVYKRNHQDETPPPEWFAQNPNRYFLWNPVARHNGHEYPDTSVDPTTDTNWSGFIAEVTLEELIIMAREREIMHADKFREYLCTRELSDIVTIPPPFKTRPELAMPSQIFSVDKNLRRIRNYDITDPASVERYKQAQLRREQEYIDDSASTSTTEEQALNLTPAVPVDFKRRHAILIGGPSGIGKSCIIQKFFGENNLQYVRIDDIFLEDEHWKKKILPNIFVWCDDFTSTKRTFDAFSSLSIDYDAGSLNCLGLLATYNPESAVWHEAKIDDKNKIIRRCTWINMSVNRSFGWGFTSDNRTLEEKLKPEGAREKYIKLEAQDFMFREYARLPASISTYFQNEVKTARVHAIQTFVVPEPEYYDILIEFPCSFEDLEGKTASEIAKIVMKSRVAMRTPAGWKSPSYTQMIVTLGQLAPLFASVKAHGEIERFVRIFNQQALTTSLSHSLLIKIPGTAPLGFVPLENGRIVAYMVDQGSTDRVSVADGEIYLNDIHHPYDQPNEVYKEALRKSFAYSAPKSVVFTEEQEVEMRRKLLRTTQFGQFIQAVVPGTSLFIKLSAILLAFSDVVYDSSEDSTRKSRKRMRRRRHLRKRKDYSSDYTESPDSSSTEEEDGVRDERKNFKHKGEDPPTKGGSGGDTAHRDRHGNSIRVDQPAPMHHDTGRTRVEFSRTKRDQPKKSPKTQDIDNIRALRKTKEERKNFKNKGETEPVKGGSDGDTAHRDKRANHVRPDDACTSTKVEGYDQQIVRPPTKNISMESLINDAQLVRDIRGSYGLTYNGSICFANEISHGSYTITTIPRNNDWSLVKLESPFAALRGRRKFNLDLRSKNLESHLMDQLLALSVYFDPSTIDADFSSVFATSMAFGVPLDVESKQMHPEMMLEVFNNTTGMAAPDYFIGFTTGLFPEFRMRFNIQVATEGMLDTTLREHTNTALSMAVPITHQGHHLLFGHLIGKNIILAPAHVLKSGTDLQCTVAGQHWDIELQSKHKCDLAVFAVTSPQFPMAKDRTGMYIKRSDMVAQLAVKGEKMPGYLVIPPYCEMQWAHTNHCVITALVEADENRLDGKWLNYSGKCGTLSASGVSVAGDCGSFLFLQNKQLNSKLVGMHRAGSNTLSISILITQELAKSILENPTSFIASSPQDECIASEEQLAAINVPKEITMRAQYKRCNTTSLTLVGTSNKMVFVPDSTRIHRTGLVIPEYDDYEPSLMSSHDPRSEGFRPLDDGLKRYGKRGTLHEPDQARLDEAFMEIGNEYATKIAQQGKTVRMLTKTEAVNEPPYAEYHAAGPIDRSGSAGFPHILGQRKCKKDFLEFNEKQNRWYFKTDVKSSQISSRISQIIEDAKRDIEHMHVFCVYLKDEPLKLKKIYKKKKTRLFFSGPFEYLIAFRMAFLAAMSRCMEIYNQVPTKVGISSSMHDWHIFTSQLLKVGTHGFASDVENFDSSVPTPFLKGTRLVYDAIYSRCSASQENVVENARIRRVLHSAIEGAHILSRNSVFKLSQAQVSGNPATALENSWIMWALYYLVWQDLAIQNNPNIKHYSDFRKYVGLAVYGDDNVCTVNRDVAPWFNFNTFSREAAKYGFKITDIAKTGEAVPDFLPLSELEFLKRNFTQIQGYHCGPLALSSIAKACQWIRTSSYNIKEEHCPSLGGAWPIANEPDLIKACFIGVWKELALHGEDTYNKWRDDLLKQAAELDLDLDPPRWQEAMYKNGYMVY